MYKILIIEDNSGVTSALKMLFDVYEMETVIANTPQAGLEILKSEDDIGVVIQDMNFTRDTHSGEEGKALYYAIREHDTDLPVVIITAWAQLEMAVELVKAGASNYIEKPWDDEKLVALVSNLIELREVQARQTEISCSLLAAKEALEKKADLCSCIYQSGIMQNLIEMAVRIAPSDVPVLVTGPNGTGKEKLAEIIQANSRVKEGPFIKVNIGALPDDLMEAELFGAEAGAYTGASQTRIGRFEAADGGTLFLDELGNLSASGQMKLLRVLQTGEYERLGSSKTRTCNVRIISATNADLEKEILAGRFREDLYYRLNVIALEVPPLADRREDIMPLLNEFLGEDHYVDEKVAKQLHSYPWPGNVRELVNAAQRAKLLTNSVAIPYEAFGLPEITDKKKVAAPKVEPSREMIEVAIRQNHGIIAHAARQLGLSRQALYRRIEKLGIEMDK